jgi:hypothetical protein
MFPAFVVAETRDEQVGLRARNKFGSQSAAWNMSIDSVSTAWHRQQTNAICV